MLNKKTIILAINLIIISTALYASTGTEQTITSLETILVTIFDILSSWWMDVIYLCSLTGIGVGLMLNRDDRELKKKLISWFIAIIILSSISNLTTRLFEIKDNLENIIPTSVF